MDFQNIQIKCPRCKTQILTWNGITKIPMARYCPQCGLYSVFNPETQKITSNRHKPQRKSASGARFY